MTVDRSGTFVHFINVFYVEGLCWARRIAIFIGRACQYSLRDRNLDGRSAATASDGSTPSFQHQGPQLCYFSNDVNLCPQLYFIIKTRLFKLNFSLHIRNVCTVCSRKLLLNLHRILGNLNESFLFI